MQDGGQPFQILNFIASYCFFSLYKCFLVTSVIISFLVTNIIDILRI